MISVKKRSWTMEIYLVKQTCLHDFLGVELLNFEKVIYDRSKQFLKIHSWRLLILLFKAFEWNVSFNALIFATLFSFFTPWKHQRTLFFLTFSRGYRKKTGAINVFIKISMESCVLLNSIQELIKVETWRLLNFPTSTAI